MIISHPENGSSPDFGWRYLDTSNDLTCPWYTFGALEMLDNMDLSNMSVFEYGCGLSSLWWKNKSKKWKGVDSNETWAKQCSCIHLTDEKQYITSCIGETYDIIVIDGIFRDECTEYALKCINPNGYIIIDNWYQTTTGMSESYWSKSKQLLIKYQSWIYKEPTHEDWKTAIFKIT
jgi:hypothetical protein